MEVLSFALLAVFIGMRHGMDSDHVAAIADMVGSEERKRRQVSLGLMYALGHGLIVLIIGLISILIGLKLPTNAQVFLEGFVGITLLLLGGFILYTVFVQRNEYEYKSRIKIVYEFLANFTPKAKREGIKANLSPLAFGVIGAFLIGIIHGIGVETPTQLAVITNAVGMSNLSAAMIQLFLFVIGLLISTIFITCCLSWGFVKARFRKQLFIILGSITGIYSIGLGVIMLVELVKGGV
ncbi:High-affinity nickel-transporter [Metabacillus herbersteinensis]|uniref:High-affinity nickel-transporter n=1 Tax=Metabacillus herbersteinensis TaxID=283816 RepID=A0ABV6GA59_9BACI